jgi:light-regulated signal transduction histidine kinase (bacteriophytochrome)
MNSAALQKVPTDLNEVVREVFSNQLEEEVNLSIEMQTEPLPSVPAFADQMKQLFTNLISNAVKYKKSDTILKISIRAKREDNFWKITVADNGIGFDPKYADKIFELFQRLHSRFEYEGTGIGLSICKKIVQNHGGCIKGVGNPGQGATFEIYLPANNSGC